MSRFHLFNISPRSQVPFCDYRLCILRFGVIHAVFTNLLLWCNGVMSEAEHFLNNHMRRLSALGYANLTIGKGQGVDCWLVPGRKVQ